MKKNDIVQKLVQAGIGEVLVRGHASVEGIHNWMTQYCVKYYQKQVPYEVVMDDMNKGRMMAISRAGFMIPKKGKVQWAVGDEASIKHLDSDSFEVINVKTNVRGWVVTEEATPSYQSNVVMMSDDELKEALQNLRRKRVQTAVPKKTRRTSSSIPREKMSEGDKKLKGVLDGLSAEKKAELMKKLGMV